METIVLQSPTYGGDGGSPFDDRLSATGDIIGIASITIRSGSFVDSIQVVYDLADGSTYSAPQHGGNGGSEVTITLGRDEQVYQVTGRSGSYVDQLTFHTRMPDGSTKEYGPYGGNGGSPFSIPGVDVGFFGRSGAYLDQVGIYIAV